MVLQEWIDIGVSKGIVDIVECDKRTFESCFRDWFLVKMKQNKPQSVDRIEVTYNKYYRDSDFVNLYVNDITENTIVLFLTRVMTAVGAVTYKEFGRIYQIVNNVLVYCKDLAIGGARLLDWDMIKRYIPSFVVKEEKSVHMALSDTHVTRLFRSVIDERVYELKQSACLCILLNFYLGLRVGELASICWNDLDMDNRLLYVRKTEAKFYARDDNGNRVGSMHYEVVNDVKTMCSFRCVPLTSEAVYIIGLIREWHNLKGYDSPYLAYDGTDTILVRSLDRTLRRLCVLVDVPYFNTHMIRKTFATTLHYGGTPTRAISDLLGHADMDTTEKNYILSLDNTGNDYLDYMRNSLHYKI